jgi:hypothetical protein
MVDKNTNLLELIKKSITSGNYIYTGHAQQRLQEREVTRQEVKQVLKNGFHEKKKDTFDEVYNEWNYAIKGKTLDKKNLRIVLSFDKKNMLIITVIDLDK